MAKTDGYMGMMNCLEIGKSTLFGGIGRANCRLMASMRHVPPAGNKVEWITNTGTARRRGALDSLEEKMEDLEII